MNSIGYVYDKSGMFWTDPYTPEKLKEMDDSNNPDITYIRHNLYSKKIYSDEYKLIFVNADSPHFRRWSICDAERNGFSSVCESKLHKACKLGISHARCIRVRIDGKDYLLRKKWAKTETTYQLMGNIYETDCEYAIADISDELASVLKGEVIYFEVHHKSKVKAKKIMAYTMSGFNILEFDILTKYLPKAIINENWDEEKMIQFFTDYYENVDKHYISGTYYQPIVSDIEWNGGIGKVYDVANHKEIKITIYKDRWSETRCYNIFFICDGKKYTQFDYDGKKIDNYVDAKFYAAYLVEMHKRGKLNIDFK